MARGMRQCEAVVITASNFRRVDPPKNTLHAFVNLELQPSGLTLHDCSLHRKGDSRWVAFPARPQLDRYGHVLKTPKTSKTAYTIVVEIKDREARERFQAAALAAVDRLLGVAP